MDPGSMKNGSNQSTAQSNGSLRQLTVWIVFEKMWFSSFYHKKMGPKMMILHFIFGQNRLKEGIHENYGSINCTTQTNIE